MLNWHAPPTARGGEWRIYNDFQYDAAYLSISILDTVLLCLLRFAFFTLDNPLPSHLFRTA